MLVDTPAQGHLVVLLCAHRVRQSDFGQVVLLDTENSAACGSGSDVDHEDLSLLQLRDLDGLAAVALDLHTQQSAEQVVLDLDLDVDVRELAWVPEDLPHKLVRAGQRWIDLGPDADQAAWYRELQPVLLRGQGDDPGADGLADKRALAALRNDAGPNLDLVPHPEHTLEDGATRDAAQQVVHLLPRTVHVEGTNDDHQRV
mmetsp:Transcript_34195/g.95410  ORF Transcript_34195/g.95410 Transcript_34195/m.95410 type:complete len:201 (-) Transcript_34195:108-710(-)